MWDWVRGPRAALGAFVAYLLVSIPMALHRGRLRWFVVDEWVLLTGRELDSLHGLLDRHNDHWVTVPVVAFRLLYAVFGIRSYVPYQLVAIGSHLAVVVLPEGVDALEGEEFVGFVMSAPCRCRRARAWESVYSGGPGLDR